MRTRRAEVDATQESFQPPSRASADEMARIQQAAQGLLDMLHDVSEGDLVSEVIQNSLKLLRDRTNRGDVKLIARAVGELRYALKVFAPYRDVRKISVFGSARTAPDKPDYLAAVDFGRRMAERGWMVTTGAGGGIMAAAHGGAGREPSFGLAIRLPFEQATNPHITGDDKLVNFRYFFTRKLMFLRTSHAIALFPGGYGTLDEGFEVLTLVQTGKAMPVPIVMVDHPGGGFWTQWQDYIDNQLLARGLISPSDRKLYMLTESIDEAVDEVCRFYVNYHSMRYVRDLLVLRLQHAPSDRLISQLERDFSDIKLEGKFEVRSALKAESDETEIAHLPRLTFAFNRRDHGRLRELIDVLNAQVPN
jgi:uncharacterized protein (TIGR00730 family)